MLCFLTPKELLTVSLVNKYFNTLANDAAIWRSFGVIDSSELPWYLDPGHIEGLENLSPKQAFFRLRKHQITQEPPSLKIIQRWCKSAALNGSSTTNQRDATSPTQPAKEGFKFSKLFKFGRRKKGDAPPSPTISSNIERKKILLLGMLNQFSLSLSLCPSL